jgi:hypothetical protein
MGLETRRPLPVGREYCVSTSIATTPHVASSPGRCNDCLIINLRRTLTGNGPDSGPDTIRWHLQQHHRVTVSVAWFWRHLETAGLIVAEPRKKPKTSYIRFQAELPNEHGNQTSPTGTSQTEKALRSSRSLTTTRAMPSQSPHISVVVSGGHCIVSASLSDGVIPPRVCLGRVLRL